MVQPPHRPRYRPTRAAALALTAALGLTTLAPVPAADAQATVQQGQPASLVADSVQVGAGHNLVAEGHVEVFYQGTRLTASRVVYDRAGDRLTIDGPIRQTDANGTILLADSAELSRDLKDGILRGARMVLDRQLQLVAARMDRVGGRYTQLSRAVASSCKVCAAHPHPLWEIRASRIVHDAQEHQLYFDNATLRLGGVPVFYLPRLRMPDPTLTRATGFLIPKFRNNTLLGAGFQLPYFITLGRNRDLTLSPFIATRSHSLNLRYRQAFANGGIETAGALSRDRSRPGETRGYLFADGSFALQGGYKLHFDIQTSSDPAYLLDYGISQTDRLQSDIEISRTRRNDYVSGQAFSFHSLRANEDDTTIPGLVGAYTRIHRLHPSVIGGSGSLTLESFGLLRRSTTDIVGRDVARASLGLDWRRNWVLNPGIVVTTAVQARADVYGIAQDSTWPTSIGRIAPAAALELRWPFVKTERSGATQVLEPVVQMIWAPKSIPTVPNEDSTQIEFDEGNLWSLSRFSGHDVIEQGPRANVGLRWTRHDPAGWSLGVVAGRVFRSSNTGQFTPGTGLSGGHSDWLTAVQLSSASGLSLTNRAVFDDSLSMARNELRLAWAGRRLNLGTSYVWLMADPTSVNATDPTQYPAINASEWALDADWKVGGNWTGSVAWRYDFQAERATSAGLGLNWRNECLSVDLSLSRRFTSSTSVTATTSFGLSVDLIGISGQAAAGGARRRCS